MANRAIRECDGKRMISRLLENYIDSDSFLPNLCAQVSEETDLKDLEAKNPWLATESLVVKPDQLLKRRGNNNLLLLNANWKDAKKWIAEKMNSQLTIDDITGELNNFIVEPFIKHDQSDETYLAIRTIPGADEILFYHEGGVDVGDVDAKASRLQICPLKELSPDQIEADLLGKVSADKKTALKSFIAGAFQLFRDAGFAYLEINPLVFVDGKLTLLDLAAKLDDTAEFECGKLWGNLIFPAPFGRKSTQAERHIARLDAQSGSSLKLTILNPKGRVWTMVAGGGASVVYADTIADFGFGPELANYGEYSGNPTDEETYDYARTVLDLMTKEPDPDGKDKVLLIGGGIANFTDVAKTFGGITRAIRDYRDKLKEVNTKIYVRRGGPNYKQGLEIMRSLGKELNLPIEVYGPETHMTKIVTLALAA